MTDIIFEIAKQLTFEASFKLKLLIKLLNKRLFEYIKLHKFPYNHTLLNDERIDLFPDLKELEYEPILCKNTLWKYPFKYNKIKKLKLESLTIYGLNDMYWEFSSIEDIFDFNILTHCKSLKKLKIQGISFFRFNSESYPYGDTKDCDMNYILKNLNLTYLKFNIDHHIYHIFEYTFDSITHMNLIYYHDSNFYQIHDIYNSIKSLKYLVINYSLNINNINSLSNINTVYCYSDKCIPFDKLCNSNIHCIHINTSKKSYNEIINNKILVRYVNYYA